MLDILYTITMILSCIIGSYFFFTDGRTLSFSFLSEDDQITALGKFLGFLLWMVVFVFISVMIIIPFVNVTLALGYIFYLVDTRKKKKNKNKDKILDIAYKLRYDYYSIPEPLKRKLTIITDKYKTILKGDFNTKLAKNRYEYAVIVMKETYDNDLFDKMSKQCLDDMVEMLDSIDKLFDEIIRNINQIKNVTNKNLENYMNSKVKEFNNVTKSMQSDFRKMRTK